MHRSIPYITQEIAAALAGRAPLPLGSGVAVVDGAASANAVDASDVTVPASAAATAAAPAAAPAASQGAGLEQSKTPKSKNGGGGSTGRLPKRNQPTPGRGGVGGGKSVRPLQAQGARPPVPTVPAQR